MKFGRLLANADLGDWPMVRYKALKKRIKACSAASQTIFETGGFKKVLRDDMMRIVRAARRSHAD